MNVFQDIFDLVKEKYQAQNVSEYRADNRILQVVTLGNREFGLLIGD